MVLEGQLQHQALSLFWNWQQANLCVCPLRADIGFLQPSGKSLEKEMATHFLAWRIPWIEEPGGLQFMGSQRVGHN